MGLLSRAAQFGARRTGKIGAKQAPLATLAAYLGATGGIGAGLGGLAGGAMEQASGGRFMEGVPGGAKVGAIAGPLLPAAAHPAGGMALAMGSPAAALWTGTLSSEPRRQREQRLTEAALQVLRERPEVPYARFTLKAMGAQDRDIEVAIGNAVQMLQQETPQQPMVGAPAPPMPTY